MSTKTRATLLERLRDGTDAMAWEEFFHAYGRLMYLEARRQGCAEPTAEEIVQDVMLKVFERRDTFQYDPTRGRFRDWLATVVRNRVRENRRGPAGRIRGRGGDTTDEVCPPASEQATPEAAWDTAFEHALLLVLLDVVRRQFSARSYLAFELLVLDELPTATVTQLTGLSRNAAYKARRRVLERLAQMAGTYAEDGQLPARVREAMKNGPAENVERSLGSRIEQTMRSR